MVTHESLDSLPNSAVIRNRLKAPGSLHGARLAARLAARSGDEARSHEIQVKERLTGLAGRLGERIQIR
jgi:hypothetical protein